jgi:hypothetical protein
MGRADSFAKIWQYPGMDGSLPPAGGKLCEAFLTR